MGRKAILIASGNPAGQSPLKGPDIDLREMHYFLNTKIGGSWLDSEIRLLTDPTNAELIAILMDVKPTDYAFVFFAGHGSHPAGGNQLDTIIQLQDGPCRVRDIHPACQKALIIVDACRRIQPSLRGYGTFITEHTKTAKKLNPPEDYRRIFQETLDRIGPMSNYVFSCSVGEFAGEDNRFGGFFTRAIISQAFDWGSKASGFNRSQGIVQAVLRARSIVKRTSEQNPIWISSRQSERHFPFAIHIS